MSNILLVPIYVNALCLDQATEAVDAIADFRRLPFIYNGRTHQDGTPNLSKQILTSLFEAGTTSLKAGIHLHWLLPDALTRGEHSDTGTKFPIVPNRWLILRQGGDRGTKQWLIESDYLYPENLQAGEEPAATINILVQRPTPETDQYQRYRYMGRTLELSDWQQQSNLDHEYTATLTAIGTQAEVLLFDYVQATFAAFYPNCQSVFGFHDQDYSTINPPSGLQYDVIGWYSDEQQDILQTLLQKNQGKNLEELLELIQEELRWTFELDGEIPQRTLYYSRVTFGSTGQVLSASDRINSLSRPTIAVGNSAPEALSAYLAHDYNNQTNPEGEQIRQFVQEQLEALQLSERLKSGQLDLDAKLQEARHEQGFGTQSAGILWAIAPKVSDAQTYRGIFSIPNSKSQIQSRFSLPLDLGRKLNEVNQLQEKYNQALVNIESQSQQLYTHWYEFIEKYYSEAGDSKPILYNTTEKLLNPLRAALGQTGRLEIKRDASDKLIVTAATLCFSIYSSFTYLEGCINFLNQAVAGSVSGFNWYEYLQSEFEKSNVKLPPQPPIKKREDDIPIDINITRKETQEQEWQINDQGQTYTVKVENSVLNIYIPPTYIPVSGETQLACRLAKAINDLIEAIAAHNSREETQYTLKQVPAAHYWQANDPVLFLAGEAAASTGHKRLQSGEFLRCHQWKNADLNLQTLPQETITSIQSQINNLASQAGEEDIGFNHWKQQPWTPFLMQWAVQAFPCRPGDPNANYNPEIILDNYQLERNAIDLTLKTGHENSFVETANTYEGLSILTPAANFILEERLTGYLNEELLPRYYDDKSIPEEQQTEDFLSENFQAIANWYGNQITGKKETEKAKDPIWVTLRAYEQMQTLEGQAQAIAGFNDTLLLYRPTLYLEIDDPLLANTQNKEDIKFFHEQVRWTLGYTLQYELLKLDIFNPIRSGAMNITTLWLVDTFGQFKKVVETGMNTDVITTIQMTPPNNNYQVLLPPRLAQPARLNFHWIAADSQKEEQLTAAPAITPVCGWIVPNNFDSNLEFYDTHGQALGLIDQAGTWRPTPGKTTSFNTQGYPTNPHLNKVVHYLLERGRDFQQEFISTLINSLDNIAPENFAEHPSLALLIGRPIAVVRATFNLEVQGLPTVDPSLTITVSDYPTTRGFDAVKFPIHLGDYRQFNDGLVGYWREVHQGETYVYEDNIFYAPQSNSVNNNLIKTEVEGIVFEQTVDAPPQFVTMLIDPRGTIHAKSGILPNRELRLSPENYDEALKAIEVHFLSTPVLSNQGEIIIPLPEIPQYAWSWLSRNSSGWLTSDIQPVNFNATFAAPQELYEGWLQLTPAEEGEE